MQKALLLLSLLALTALAGCVAEAPVDTAAASADPAPAKSAAPTDAAPATSEAPEATGRVRNVSESGATGDGVALCGPLGCVGHTLASESFFPVSVEGGLSAAELTLVWTAKDLRTEELTFGIAYEIDGVWTWIYESGPSPLTLIRTDLGIPAGSQAGFYVNAYRCATPTPAAPCASSSQPFHVEGALTLVKG